MLTKHELDELRTQRDELREACNDLVTIGSKSKRDGYRQSLERAEALLHRIGG